MLKNKRTLVIASIICLLPIAVGLVLWNRLPDLMVTHWGLDNQPNGYMSKATVVFGLPLFMLAIMWICIFASRFDSKKPQYSSKIMTLTLWLIPIMSLLCNLLCYTWSLGIHADIGFWVTLLLGLLFAIIGNYLPKCPQSYIVGIKLPWTLKDKENWQKTHRMAGPIWVVGGVLIALSSVFKAPWLILPIIIVMVAIPTIYSYVYYRKHK